MDPIVVEQTNRFSQFSDEKGSRNSSISQRISFVVSCWVLISLTFFHLSSIFCYGLIEDVGLALVILDRYLKSLMNLHFHNFSTSPHIHSNNCDDMPAREALRGSL